jgi:methionyl-tRNA synthetase
MLSFAAKCFDGKVPQPGELDAEERALLPKVEAGFQTVSELSQERLKVPRRPARSDGPGPRGQRLHIRYAPFGAAHLCLRQGAGRTGSAGLDRTAPWFQIKEDKAPAATSVYVILRVVDNLKTILAPILPHTAQKLHEYLGYDGQLFGTQHVVEYEEETRSHRALTYDHAAAIGTWAPSALSAGQALRAPAPLFRKLDERLIDEEYARLEG